MRGIVVSFGRAFGCTAATLFLLAGPASAGGEPAARMAPAPLIAHWAGFYAGGEVGGAWSRFDWSATNGNYFNTVGPILLGTAFDQSAKGSVIGGGFLGYNFQSGPWVYGIEFSGTASGLAVTNVSPYFPATDTYTSKIKWLATATGRVGYAWDRWLVYVKGGWAGADVQFTIYDSAALVRADTDTWANGWTVGIGADYMLTDRVALGVVYDYADLSVGGATVTCPNCGTGVGFGTPVVDGHIRLQSVMARLSVKLSP